MRSSIVHEMTTTNMLSRIRGTLAEPAIGYPHYADTGTGQWTTTSDGFWTGGFWGGLLALAAVHSGDQKLLVGAEEVATQLTVRATSDTAFRGFLFFFGAGVAHLVGKSDRAGEVALAGAEGLAASFNHNAGLIPLGLQAEESDAVGSGAANIDAVPGTVALLAWAARETGRQSFADMARDHARRHVEYCLREDGSVCQSAEFDPRDGTLVRRYTHKGLSDGSTWARAQAWAMLGFAQAAHWVDAELAAPAVTAADWWIEHLPAGRIAPWDFDAGPDAPRDTSATAIAAAALLRLADLVPSRTHYRDHAASMVATLCQFVTPTEVGDRRNSGMLTSGCFDPKRGVATDAELVWGDYFLFESLLFLQGVISPTAL